MTITYTFAADAAAPQLRGITCHGGVFCRVDGKRGEPDAVQFSTIIDGKRAMARIAGKPELEAALAARNAAIAAKAAVLAAMNWTAYEVILNAMLSAESAYKVASERGYPARQAAALKKADEAFQAARAAYPAADLYNTAQNFSRASHDVKATAGVNAMAAIEQGADPVAAIAEMKAVWAAHCDNAAVSA